MRTTKIVSITMPPPLFEEAQVLAKQENRTMSELMREALRRYQRERLFEKVRTHMEAVADRIGVHTEEDVVRVVREFRQEAAEKKKAPAQVRTQTPQLHLREPR
jgi:CopG family transcriptional regulator/antitoxin EndoAI